MHGLKALKSSEGEIELTFKNVSVGIVGKGEPFRLLNEEELKKCLLALHQQQQVVEPMEVHH
jgi:hypothetical protein